MKNKFSILITLTATLLFVLAGCKDRHTKEAPPAQDWNSRLAKGVPDSLPKRQTYLPVYSQIYEMSESLKLDLTATISIRNTSVTDTLYVSKIDYYNTEGHLIRKYLPATVFIRPAETVEIIISRADNEGGSGGNFIFEWSARNEKIKPLFEAVMISTAGQQGISFTCRGVDL